MTTPEQTEPGRYRRYYRQIGEIAAKPKTRAYFTAVFSFLAVSLFGLYAVLPTMRTILFLRREIVDKTKVNQQMEDKITALIESQAAYEAVSENLAFISDAIPETAKPVELALSLRNLSRITAASTSAVQIASVPLVGGEATASAERSSDSPSFPITVIMDGSYVSLKSFIDGLLSLKRILTIDSMRFTPSAEAPMGAPGGVSLQLVLQLKTYYQNQ